MKPNDDSEDRLWPWWSEAAIADVAAALRSGHAYTIDTHPAIDRFEAELADLHDTDHALLCHSGTAALAAAFFALALTPGCDVLVPTNTFRATVTPLLLLGYRPILCDCDEGGNLDLDDAAARLTPATEALVVTHVNGLPLDLVALERFARANALAVVEDASHAHGVRWNGRSVGSIGDVTALSCGTTKLVSGGMAGAIVTRDRARYERCVLFTQPKHRGLREVRDGQLRSAAALGLGVNERPTPTSAILALDHLRRLPETIETKNRHLRQLDDLLRDALPALRPPAPPVGRTHGTWYKYACRWTDPSIPRDELVRSLRDAGVPVRAPIAPLHRSDLWSNAALLPTQARQQAPAAVGDLPMADRLAEQQVEFSTRELYSPRSNALDRWRPLVERAAEALATNAHSITDPGASP